MAILDENLTRFIKNRNIFNPDNIIGGQIDPRVNIQTGAGTFTGQPISRFSQDEPLDIRTRMDEIYKPERDMQERYTRLLDEFPVRNKPSFARKVVASMAGAGGDIRKSDAILHEPYYRGVEDWKLRADVTGSAAANEARLNRDQANFALQEISRQLQQERLQLDTLKNQQIYETKVADLERKIADSDNRLKLAYDQLQFRQGDAAAQLQFRQAQLDAQNARAEADRSLKELQLAEARRLHNAQIERMQSLTAINKAREARGLDPVSEEQVIRDAEGNVVEFRTITRQRGNVPPNTSGVKQDIKLPSEGERNVVEMLGPDGKTYYVRRENLAQAKKDGLKEK